MIRIRAARPHLGDIQLRYATLLGRLGPALDGPGTLQGADAWYCILEGTREQSVAEAQAMALNELVARTATDPGTERRAILLAADDYSAVSRRVPISNLNERGRSLGLGVQVSAQSWQGLGADDDERYRIAATADGGIWLLHTPYPEPELETPADPNDPAAQALRERIRNRYRELHGERATLETQRDQLDIAATEVNDPALLDELPILGDILTGAPAGLTEQLFEAFHVQAVYSKELHQVTIHVTITDATPQAIAQLLADPRITNATQPAATPARTGQAFSYSEAPQRGWLMAPSLRFWNWRWRH